MLKSFFMLPLAMMLAGCVTSEGYISRKAEVTFIPPPSRMKRVIESVSGVSYVDYKIYTSGWDWDVFVWYAASTNDYHRTSGEIWFRQYYRGAIEYAHTVEAFHTGAPNEAKRQLLGYYPIMLEIEKRLEAEGLTNLTTSAREGRSKIVR